VRWDSDHVVSLDDSTRALFEEIVRGEHLARVHIGLDYFDASINRIAAWVIGARNTLKALLWALLEPTAILRKLERAGEYTERLALLEELKTLPFGAVWQEHCTRQNVPPDHRWMEAIQRYEREVFPTRATG
jgi:L-rhamnose isomerase